jgi:hypothetical protein
MSAGFITVVSGLPRSGTSLAMQMLAAGGMEVLTDELRAADEDNPRGYFEFEAVKRTRSDPGWVPLAAGKAVKVVHLLLPDLPPGFEYRVILMRRDAGEVLASQRTMLARLGRPGAQLSDERLAAIYAAQLERVREWLRSQGGFRVLEVEYADCLCRADETASRILEFLEVPLDGRAMAAAVDPSLYRQRSTQRRPT